MTVFDDQLPRSGYAVREEQLAMASFVQTAIARNRHLLAEAGVGTGKTFAYLIPAFAQVMATGRPVIVATHTIALQEQLVGKDIPAVRELLDVPMQSLLAKGKEHYLCPRREMAVREAEPEATGDLATVLAWARRTRTGDRHEIPGVPDAVWGRVNLTERERCSGCRYEFTCPTANTRRKWQGASGILVTNHNQFFADLALRAHGVSLFASPGLVVLDEAHAVPDTAREMLGARLRLGGLLPLVERSRYELARADRSWMAPARHASAFVQGLQARIRWKADPEATRFAIVSDPALVEAAGALTTGLSRLVASLGAMPDRPSREMTIRALEHAADAVRGLLFPDRHITWAEATGKGRRDVSLVAVPRDLAAVLDARLFDRAAPVVLTSATLSAAGDFGYIKHELGLKEPLTCSVGSPFDYATQARLYMPDDLPDPSDDAEAFYEAAIERLKDLLVATRGRALVLFTAKSALAKAHQALTAWGQFPVLRQDRGDPTLVDRFRADEGSVLLGTGYWEGLDVAGATLSCVVIVKLPFPPEDPLLLARQAAAKERGEDPFDAVNVAEMLLKLQQGAGRLIRRDTDRGVVAVLDPRAVSRDRYAAKVAAALPDAPRLTGLDEVASFLDGAD